MTIISAIYRNVRLELRDDWLLDEGTDDQKAVLGNHKTSFTEEELQTAVNSFFRSKIDTQYRHFYTLLKKEKKEREKKFTLFSLVLNISLFHFISMFPTTFLLTPLSPFILASIFHQYI